jgi:hypothetical protein
VHPSLVSASRYEAIKEDIRAHQGLRSAKAVLVARRKAGTL